MVKRSFPPMTRRSRFGCLGCLGQCLVVLVLGGAALVAIDWVFAPWSFHLGGTFRPLPLWQGRANIHAPSGDYVLYLWMMPTPSGSRVYNNPSFNGSAALCTPRGERYVLRLRASMFERPGTDTNGKEMRIEVYRRPWNWSFTGRWDHRPELVLRGRWRNPDLVTSDGGTLAASFRPDGSLDDSAKPRQPLDRDQVPVVIHEVPWSTVFGDCR